MGKERKECQKGRGGVVKKEIARGAAGNRIKERRIPLNLDDHRKIVVIKGLEETSNTAWRKESALVGIVWKRF